MTFGAAFDCSLLIADRLLARPLCYLLGEMTVEPRTLTIRQLERGDLPLLAAEVGLGRDHIEGRWSEREQGLRTMFVAETDGRFAGGVSFDVRPDFPGLLHLYALAVAPPLQRGGVGTALIRAVEDESRRRGLEGVYLGVAEDNPDARRLYESLGYHGEGEPFVSRWTWRGDNGEERQVEESVYRLFKRFAARGRA